MATAKKAKEKLELVKAMDLGSYAREPKQSDMVLRSVNITQAQYQFLNRMNLNLSKMVRKWLDEVMPKSIDKKDLL